MNFDYPSFWKNASPKRKRIYLFLFFLILAFLVTLAGSFVPLSASESQEIYNRAANQTAQGSVQLAVSIFLNNFPLCLGMFIPLFGAIFGLYVMFSTGVAIGAELRVETSPGFQGPNPATITPSTAILALTFLFVVFALEYVCYSTGMSESIWLFRRITQRNWRSELKNLVILIALVATVLAVSAIVETFAIKAGY